MKNGIIYSVNNDQRYLNMLINSINSLYATNWDDLLSKGETKVFVLTDDANLPIDREMLDPRADITLIVLPDDAYVQAQILKKKYTKHAFYRFEMFKNPQLTCLDNSLWVDCDTEFGKPITDLMVERTSPTVMMAREAQNHLLKHGKCVHEGLNFHGRFCNSGVLLLTPRLIGEENLKAMYDELLRLVNKYPFRAIDQDALNYMLDMEQWRGMKQFLAKTYNYAWFTFPRCTKEEAEKATGWHIRHFGGIPDNKCGGDVLKYLWKFKKPEC